MPKLPHLSGSDVIKLLAKIGFFPTRQRGSHVILVRYDANGKRAVVVPIHEEIDIGTLLNIIRQAGLKRKEFLELLR